MTKNTRMTKVGKGGRYELKDGTLIECTAGRLRSEGENGKSFEAKTIDPLTGKPKGKADRFYLDEIGRVMNARLFAEIIEVNNREADAIADARKTAPKRFSDVGVAQLKGVRIPTKTIPLSRTSPRPLSRIARRVSSTSRSGFWNLQPGR